MNQTVTVHKRNKSHMELNEDQQKLPKLQLKNIADMSRNKDIEHLKT